MDPIDLRRSEIDGSSFARSIHFNFKEYTHSDTFIDAFHGKLAHVRDSRSLVEGIMTRYWK